MPRNVRNFFIEGQIDGSKTPIGTGPVSAGGGFELVVRLRENGAVSSRALYVRGYVADDGILVLIASDGHAQEVVMESAR
jgi:hypothetical protein